MRGENPPSPRRAAVASRHPAQLTERDHQLLRFVADHRLVLADHARALLGTSLSVAQTRLRALRGQGLVTQRRIFYHQPDCYQVTSRGLAALGSELSLPSGELREYLHDVGLAWLWLAAQRGAFGAVVEVLSERQLRSRDGLPRRGGALVLPGAGPPRHGVRLDGFGPRGHERLHYPDLVLRTGDGRRIALELELTAKGLRRREKILSAYATARNVDSVIYLANRPAVARGISASITKLHLAARVQVRPFVWTETMQRLERQLSGGRGAAVVAAPETARAQAREAAR